MASAASMIMSAVFPIDLRAAHSGWLAAQRIATGTAFAFSAAALRYCRTSPRWLLGVGIVTVLVNLILSMFFNTTYVLEWPVIGRFLSYVLLLGIVTGRLFGVKAATRIAAR